MTAEESEAAAVVLGAAEAVVVEAAAVVLGVAAEAVVVAAPAAGAAEAGTRNSLPQIFTDHPDNNERTAELAVLFDCAELFAGLCP